MKKSWSQSSKETPSTLLDVTRPAVPGHAEMICMPTISMAARAYQKLFAFIRHFDEEIAGMGFVDEHPGNHLHIADVFLVKQSGNTGVHVDITDGIHELQTKLALANEDEAIARMKFWWHSHVNMPALWSSTDDGTAENFGGDYLVSAVGNKRGELRVRLDVRKPLKITVDDLPLYVGIPGNLSVEEQCKREIDELVVQSPIKRFFDFSRKPPEEKAWEKRVEAEARHASGYPSTFTPYDLPAPLGDGGLNEGATPGVEELVSTSARPLGVIVEPVESLESAIESTSASAGTESSSAPAAPRSEPPPPPAPEPRPTVLRPIDPAALESICGRIRAFPKVEDVELTASEITINTHNLLVSAKYEELWDVGAWTICIPLDALEPHRITCQSRRSKVRRSKQGGWVHPHVSSTGTICWDKDVATTISFALKERQYEIVAQLVIALLDEGREYDTRNPLDTYGRTLRQIGDRISGSLS